MKEETKNVEKRNKRFCIFVLKKSTRFSENTRYYLSYSKKWDKILGGFEIFRPIVKEGEKERKRVEVERKGEETSEASGNEWKWNVNGIKQPQRS